MDNYIPMMYQKNIFDINYEKLKKQGIKVLAFDLDNTILKIDDATFDEPTKNLLEHLQNDFKIAIITNNTGHRIKKISFDALQIIAIPYALKPLPVGLKRLVKRCKCKKEEICIIGDQLVTDVLGGNLFGAFTVLVDPLGEKDLKVTSLNRMIERKKLKKLAANGLLERGNYYE